MTLRATIVGISGEERLTIFVVSEMTPGMITTRVYRRDPALESTVPREGVESSAWVASYFADRERVTELRAEWDPKNADMEFPGLKARIESAEGPDPLIELSWDPLIFPHRALLKKARLQFKWDQKEQIARQAFLSYSSIDYPGEGERFDGQPVWLPNKTIGTQSGFLKAEYDCLVGSYLSPWIGSSSEKAQFFGEGVFSGPPPTQAITERNSEFAKFRNRPIIENEDQVQFLRVLSDFRVDEFTYSKTSALPIAWKTYESEATDESGSGPLQLTRERVYKIAINHS